MLTSRWLSRSALSLVLALSLAPGCASVTVDDDEGARDDDMMGDGDGDLGTGGLSGTGGRAGTGGRSGSGGGLGSGGGDLVGDSGGASSGGVGSDSGGSSSGGTSSGGAGSGGAGSGGAGSGGAPSGDMCDAALWASGPQGTYEPGDHVTAVCDDSGLSNGNECYGYDGLHWFYCEGDNYQCSAYDPNGTSAHGVWQIDPTPCP